MLNFYEHMKPKAQKAFNVNLHFDKLFNVLLTRFVWDGLPDNIPAQFIEGYLITNGTCGVRKVGKDLWAFPGSHCGETKGYLPKDYVGCLPNVQGLQGEIGKVWAVGFNNWTATPEFLLYQYSNILGEIDVSEKVNVMFSRFMRIPKVHDEKDKLVVKQAIQNIADGKIDAIVSDNVMAEIGKFFETPNEDPFLDLVDVKEVDKLQYLNQYRDNIIKRFFQVYGQKSQVTSKMAQMSPDEVHANDSLAMILSDEALNCRQKFCDDVNALFGTNWSVSYNRCWKDEIQEMNNDDMTNVDEMGGDDNVAEDLPDSNNDGNSGDEA